MTRCRATERPTFEAVIASGFAAPVERIHSEVHPRPVYGCDLCEEKRA